MAESKKVSIILCFYNEEKYLAQAIDSVLAQTYSDFELILVNDGSADGSDQIVRGYSDARIKYISYEGNKHQAYARNRGLEIATGDYIGFFDGDDIMVPDKLEKQVRYLEEHPDVTVVSGGYRFMNAEGIVGSKFIKPQYCKDEEIRAFMLYGNCVAFAGAALFRRELIDRNHICFDEKNIYCEDYQLFIDMLPYGKFANIEECFFFYRFNYGSKSSEIVKRNSDENDKELKNVLKRAWETRGFLLEESDFSFMYDFLYKNKKIRKPADIANGIRTYQKVQRQAANLKLKEGKLILRYYRRQWLRTYKIYWWINKIIRIEG